MVKQKFSPRRCYETIKGATRTALVQQKTGRSAPLWCKEKSGTPGCCEVKQKSGRPPAEARDQISLFFRSTQIITKPITTASNRIYRRMSDSERLLAGVGRMVTLPVAGLLHTCIEFHTSVWIGGGGVMLLQNLGSTKKQKGSQYIIRPPTRASSLCNVAHSPPVPPEGSNHPSATRSNRPHRTCLTVRNRIFCCL